MRRLLTLLLAGIVLGSCGMNSRSFSPNKKYSPQQLQKDYSIYQETLEQATPDYIGIHQKIAWKCTLPGEGNN